MTFNNIKCEVVTVKTDTGVCPGMAKTKQGEVFIIGARTPVGAGICCQAFSSLSSMKLSMMLTDKMTWEKNDYFDIICPHGFVTYRLSRYNKFSNTK